MSVAAPAPRPPGAAQGYLALSGLMLGYIGVYLCRKNLAVALPLMQSAFGASREQLGWISTAGTLAYTAGKLGGPLVDRLGGRVGFLLSLLGVAFFGAASALVPVSTGPWLLLLITVGYALNRFFGAFGWGAMLKLAPTWFRAERLATVVGVLSLSYIGGGVCATLLARLVVQRGGGWRAVLLIPALVLTLLWPLCALLVRRGPLRPKAVVPEGEARPRRPSALLLLRNSQFLIVCVMSFAITLLREAFNTWSVDFLAGLEKGGVAAAALKSTSFDLMGGVSIFLMGCVYDRVPPWARRWLLFTILLTLALLLWCLQPLVARDPHSGAVWVGLVGLLVYGPYSLLAGVFAVEGGGEELAASASGIIDAVGYVAGALAGVLLGRIVDVGGYRLGFQCLAVLTVFAALLSLGKRPGGRPR